jgi:hypothetical protein
MLRMFAQPIEWLIEWFRLSSLIELLRPLLNFENDSLKRLVSSGSLSPLSNSLPNPTTHLEEGGSVSLILRATDFVNSNISSGS